MIPSPQPHKPIEIPRAPAAPHTLESKPADTKPSTLENKAILNVFQQLLRRLEELPPRVPRIHKPECYFCGEAGHQIRECTQVEPSIQSGRCKRNTENRIVLPSGARVPNNFPGKNLCEKLDEYHRRNAINRDDKFVHIEEAHGSYFYETRDTRLHNFCTRKAFVDAHICSRQLTSKETAVRVPTPPVTTSTSSPTQAIDLHQQGSRFYKPYVPAPVSIFQSSNMPWPTPVEAKATPVKLTRASIVLKPFIHPDYVTTPTAAIRPPPDSRPSTPAQPTTLQTPPIYPAYTVGCRTPVPAMPALTPSFLYSPASPSPSDISKPTPFAPSPDHFTVQAPTKPPSFKSAPVSHPPPFFAAPLSAPAASSEEHAATHPRPPASSSTPAPPAPLKRQWCFVRLPSSTSTTDPVASKTTIPAARCTTPPAVSITALVAAPATFAMPKPVPVMSSRPAQ
ncbi:hypothetical protein H0H81_005018, partial [Sphagnurus paluster]